jgi:hypothetical protein
MRKPLLILIAAAGLIAFATAESASASTVAAPTAESPQGAVWAPRKLVNFAPPYIHSCDRLYEKLRFVLLQLGARDSDLQIDQRTCLAGSPIPSVDATFSVLAPTNGPGSTAAAAAVPANWQTVELRVGDVGVFDCAYLKYVTAKILPLFSTKAVKLIPAAVCNKFDVGLRAEILRLPQQVAASQ